MGPVFTEWYWTPIFAAPVVLAISAVAGMSIIVAYGLFFLVRKAISPDRVHDFITRRKVLVLFILIAVVDVPIYHQYRYVQEHRYDPESHPCERVFCLDNYFPVTIPAAEVDTSAIDFGVFLASPPPQGFKLRFLEISPPDRPIGRWSLADQDFITATYTRGSSTFYLVETRFSLDIDRELPRHFDAGHATPKGRVVYQSGNTLAATVIEDTIVYIENYSVNDDAPPPPELTALVDSLAGTPVSDLVFMPRGRRR